MKISSLNLFLILISPVFLIEATFANQRNEPKNNDSITCISGNPNSTHLIDALAAAKQTSSISKIILKSTSKPVTTESAAPCAECLNQKNAGMNKNFDPEALANLAKYAAGGTSLNIKCLEAAADKSFVTKETPEVHCPLNKEIKDGNSCINREILEYQNLVVSNMYSCFSKYSASPINPSSLFEIQSLESVYKTNYSSYKGHGLGQLTNIFIKDAQIEFRGLPMMKKIVADTSAECGAAREILSLDTKRKPILSTPKDRCRFMQIGDGLERNVLYSLIGLNTLWKNDISPHFTGYSKKHGTHAAFPRLMEKLLQIGYGAGGPVAAKAVIKRGGHLPPDRFLALLESKISGDSGEDLNLYVRGIAGRQKDIKDKITDSALKDSFATNGARACLN